MTTILYGEAILFSLSFQASSVRLKRCHKESIINET